MSIFDRLSIGTANFGKEYNGICVSAKDADKILNFAWDIGIRSLDCATAYNWYFGDTNKDFEVTLKMREDDGWCGPLPDILMAHRSEEWEWLIGKGKFTYGVSVYEPNEVGFIESYSNNLTVLQCPYSIYDRRFEPYFAFWHRAGVQIQVRSVFLRGKILDKVRVKDCMIFPLLNPNVDKMIIGVDSLDQLKQNVEYFQWLDTLKVDDENIIDPRRWEQK